MQLTIDNKAKAPDPSRSTMFVVDSIGEAENGVAYMKGAAYDYDKKDYQYMAVRLSSMKDYLEFYKEIYPEGGADFAKLQAKHESDKTRFDNSIQGVAERSISVAEGYARKNGEPLSINQDGDTKSTMFNQLSSRLVVAFDNLKVTNELIADNGEKIQMAVATRVQALNPIADNTKSSANVRMGYVDYTPAHKSRDGQDKVMLKTVDDNIMLSIAQLQSEEGKDRLNRVIKTALNHTMSDYGLPEAERKGTLSNFISYKGANGSKELLEFNFEPEIDYAKRSSSDASYIPHKSYETTMTEIRSGSDYASRMYQQDPTNPKVDENVVIRHDLIRFLDKALTDYDAAMKGDFLRVAKHTGDNVSPAVQHVNQFFAAVERDPSSVQLSSSAVTNTMLGMKARNNLISSKNIEYMNLVSDKPQDRVVNSRVNAIPALESLVRSSFKDENGETVLNNIVTPLVVTLIQSDTKALAYPRGVTPFVTYPHLDNNNHYTKSTESVFNDRPMPNGLALSKALTLNTTHGEFKSPLNTPAIKAQAEALDSHLVLYQSAKAELPELSKKEINPLPKVDKPYYFNQPVLRTDINNSANQPLSPNNVDRLTPAQVKRTAFILGSYLNAAQADKMGEIFNTEFRQERMDELMAQMNSFHPNYFMTKQQSLEAGHGDRVYGGYKVIEDLINNPSPDKLDLQGEFADMVEVSLRQYTPDDVLIKRFSPEPQRAPETLQTAIPDASKDSVSAITNDLYNQYSHENQKSLDDILGIKEEVILPANNAPQPRIR